METGKTETVTERSLADPEGNLPDIDDSETHIPAVNAVNPAFIPSDLLNIPRFRPKMKTLAAPVVGQPCELFKAVASGPA